VAFLGDAGAAYEFACVWIFISAHLGDDRAGASLDPSGEPVQVRSGSPPEYLRPWQPS
jgi:hypothetical protein